MKLDYDAMWKAVKAARYEAPDVHIACTQEWLDYMRRRFEPEKADWPGGSIGGSVFGGITVYVTDDVTSPAGWEARPGKHPTT
jgi:hypothetical protein